MRGDDCLDCGYSSPPPMQVLLVPSVTHIRAAPDRYYSMVPGGCSPLALSYIISDEPSQYRSKHMCIMLFM